MLDITPNIMDKDNLRFCVLRSTVDNVFRQLRSQGIGTEVRHALIITANEEEQLWLLSVLTTTTPKGLQREVFLLAGWPGTEKLNFHFVSKPGCDLHCAVYEEHSSKNHPGGLKDLRVENKTVPCYAVPDNSLKSLVSIFQPLRAQGMPLSKTCSSISDLNQSAQ